MPEKVEVVGQIEYDAVRRHPLLDRSDEFAVVGDDFAGLKLLDDERVAVRSGEILGL